MTALLNTAGGRHRRTSHEFALYLLLPLMRDPHRTSVDRDRRPARWARCRATAVRGRPIRALVRVSVILARRTWRLQNISELGQCSLVLPVSGRGRNVQ